MPRLDIAKYSEPDGLDWNLGTYIHHFSASSAQKLRMCPYQFQRSYLWRLKERPGESRIIGSAVHAALEHNFRPKVESGRDIPVAELLEWYDDTGFQTTVDLEERDAGQDVAWDTDTDSARARGRSLLAAYRNEVAPRIQPLATEGRFEVDFGLPVPMIGRYDVLTADSIVDIKTGKRSNRKPQPKWRLQAMIYSIASTLPVEFHSVTATEKTRAVTILTPLEAPDLLVAPNELEVMRMKVDLRSIVAEACMYMERYGPDEDWPTHGRSHEWACDYCSWRSGCPAWAD